MSAGSSTGVPSSAPAAAIDWRNGPVFIERQFPVSKVSKESYKERKANYSQTLTGLGKWWGRKPLILVRSAVLGLLLPDTGDAKKDREIFLKLLTMDASGLWLRKTKAIPYDVVWQHLDERERREWFEVGSTPERPRVKRGTAAEARAKLQRLVFERMSYDEKLEYCDRPEQVAGPTKDTWAEVNAHLGTSASSLAELVRELGTRRFGHTPRVGDAFCGGGSIPFEAARIGCEAYGSDLNPVAALLTWAGLHIIGGGQEVAERVESFLQRVFDAVDAQVTEWGIEHNEKGWRADAYLYCNEAICPECGWKVPLAPAWVIGEKSRCIARLVPKPSERRFDIEILSGVSPSELAEAKRAGTAKDSRLCCPNPDCGQSTPIAMLRRDGGEGLRLWEAHEVAPRPDDVFQERLYCIRWVETYEEDGVEKTRKHYRAPTDADLAREHRCLNLLRERFVEWQRKGYIPSRRIESGAKTDEPIRTRGWTHWHHLFAPRQLLTLGALAEAAAEKAGDDKLLSVAGLLGVGRAADYNAKLSRWHPHGANEKSEQVFSNQALNTMYNYAARPLSSLANAFTLRVLPETIASGVVEPLDARAITQSVDIWITDPPYADAINYHELSEFFLAWYEKRLSKLFPLWYADSKRALAVRGADASFKKGMVDCYRSLARQMSENGLQVVMFTHQDSAVWADLTLILWAAGLRVTGAWTVHTETDSAMKEGNYVQGTVLLILRKQTSQDTAFLDVLYPEIEDEVKAQLDAMLALDDKEDPNFGDADLQLAAYAAALRVLTRYKGIEDMDIGREIARERARGEKSPVEKVIDQAVEIANNHLKPEGLDRQLWLSLSPEERFYLRGIEIESHGEYRAGVYQELARGFRVRSYQELLEAGRANQTRLRTPTEFGRRDLGGAGFAGSLLRQVLFAVRETARTDAPVEGRAWLRAEVPNYWDKRGNIVALLEYLARMGFRLGHWEQDAKAAGLLAGAVRNDHV